MAAMSGGRIRSLKPEILEDEKVAALSDPAFRIFIAMITLADDHGNLRWNAAYFRGAIWWGREVGIEVVRGAMTEVEAHFAATYVARGQTYAHINNWERHQRITNRGKPKVPQPCDAEMATLELPKKSSEPVGEIRLARAPAHPAAGMGEGYGMGSGMGDGVAGADEATAPSNPSPEPVADWQRTPANEGGPQSRQETLSGLDSDLEVTRAVGNPKARKTDSGGKHTRVDPNWQPKPETVERFRGEGWDCLPEVERFVNKYFNMRGDKAMMIDWDRAFINWMKNAIGYGNAKRWIAPVPPPKPTKQAPVTAGDPVAALECSAELRRLLDEASQASLPAYLREVVEESAKAGADVKLPRRGAA